MTKKEERRLLELQSHYSRWTQEADTRRTRKNGWNQVINAYMGKLPANWPYNSVVTSPRIREAILSKTSRLLNTKLKGRLVPREGGDVIKARINNALLDFQWDFADEGGSMIEKVAHADQVARLFGAAFVFVYWDVEKDSNEIKVCDPRDIGFDGSATHTRNARWVQYREWTIWNTLERRGYDVKKLKRLIKKQGVTSQKRSTTYESQVKANRGLENRVGEQDDEQSPVIEVVTEYSKEKTTLFLPKYDLLVDDGENKYTHGKIPFAQLRYYPLGDDIYGESEVEHVMPLQRAINAVLCGTIDEANLRTRPPLKIASSGVRIETIEYGPGAQMIMQNPNLVQQMQFDQGLISQFNSIYPALVADFNTAMGDQSLGVSNARSKFNNKTATEVRDLAQQQNSRDQYNQLYLSEFLKDIVMMWMSNNRQYLFDDPSKHFHIIKIIGKDNVRFFKKMKLDDTDLPDFAAREIADTIMENPEGVSDAMLEDIVEDASVPNNGVIRNPNESNPEAFEIVKKLDVKSDDEEADLYLTPDDFEGDYDYIPDVTSMAAGALEAQREARETALSLAMNPAVLTMLQEQGETMNIKQLLISTFEDAGERDAEGLFMKNEKENPEVQTPVGAGQAAPNTGTALDGANLGVGGIQDIPQTVPA